MFVIGLYISEVAVFSSTWPSEFVVGGINDPYLYIHCWGVFKGCCWWYLFVVLLGGCFKKWWYYIRGVFPCV